MSMELLMQYATFALMAVGVLAFLTALITQVIKEMPGLRNKPVFLEMFYHLSRCHWHLLYLLSLS